MLRISANLCSVVFSAIGSYAFTSNYFNMNNKLCVAIKDITHTKQENANIYQMIITKCNEHLIKPIYCIPSKKTTTYISDGEMRCETYYTTEDVISYEIYYTITDGKLLREIYYDPGGKMRREIYYDTSRHKTHEDIYIDNELLKSITYYPNRQKYSESNFERDCILHGNHIEWYNDGNIKMKCVYVHGVEFNRKNWTLDGKLQITS